MRDNPKMRGAVVDALWRNPVIGLAILDSDQPILRDANNAFLELLDSRFRTKKTLGTPIEQCWMDCDLNGLREAFRRVQATGVPFHADSLKLNRSQLGPITISCSVIPLTDVSEEKGEGQALLLVATERKSEVPSPAQMSLLDNHTRHALTLRFRLSAREIDIISECLQGKKNRQIAMDLHIGISTVKRHLESAYRKMGITSSRALPLAILNVVRALGAPPAEADPRATPEQRSQAA